MAILSKACKPDNFESHNSLKPSFTTNIQGLHSNFVDCNLSLNHTLLTFLLCVRQTWMTQLILAISPWGYLPLIQKDSGTHAWSHSLRKRRTSLCMGFLLIFLTDFTSLIVFFLLYWSPSSSLCTVFDSISSNIDDLLSINLSAVFVFGDFSVYHKDWLTYSGGTDQTYELV